MSQPTKGDVFVSVPLTNVLVAYIQQASNFIATKVFPNIPVQAPQGRYWTYPKSEWFRDEAQERAPGTESVGSGYTVDNTPTYDCRVYAWHKDVPDQVRAAADPILNLDADASRLVATRLLMKREAIWVSKFFTDDIWTRQVTGVNSSPSGAQCLRWDVTNSTPIEDINAESIRMAEQTGYRPNTLVVSPYVFNVLRNHPSVLDRIKYTQRGLVTQDLLASLFEVDQFLVPFATRNTAAEGETDSMNFFYGKSALLMYTPSAPSMMSPAAGYTFSWTGLIGGEAMGARIKKIREELKESDRIEGQMAFDMKLVCQDVGAYFKTVIS